MSEEALRAIILDNDQTTGSYTLVYSILIGLKTTNNITQENYKIIFKRLAAWMIKHNVFRPGIKSILETIAYLKKENAVDAVIIYTNQINENIHMKLKEGNRITSLPRTISYMMQYLNDDKPLFDYILTRPLDANILSNGWCPKKFSRVLDLYPNKPKDIRKIVFIDDMGTPEYICAHDIPETHKSKEAWYPISPYYRHLSTREIIICVWTCFEGIYDLKNNKILLDVILDCYEERHDNQPSSVPIAVDFLTLSDHLIQRFPLPV